MIRAHYRSPPFLIPKSFLAVYNVEKGFLMTWPKLLSLLFLVAPLMLLVGCDGGSQPLDTPTPGGEAIAKVEAEPSSAKELRQVKMFGFQIYILVLTVVAFIII